MPRHNEKKLLKQAAMYKTRQLAGPHSDIVNDQTILAMTRCAMAGHSNGRKYLECSFVEESKTGLGLGIEPRQQKL